jgi:D-alanyl-D-alanine carboxypeptidase
MRATSGRKRAGRILERKPRGLGLGLAVLSLTVTGCGAKTTTPVNARHSPGAYSAPESLQATLASVRDSLGIRGVSAAVIFPDGRLWTGEAGESSPGVPIQAATLFDAGSVAKMFTAAVILGLAEENALDLDEPIGRWLPDAPNADRVTPRMLLTHTSGWADAWGQPSFIPRLVSAPMRRWTAVDLLAATPEPIGEPGEGWSYSSSGYVALGSIAEAVTGRDFGTLLQARVLDRLELDRTVHGAYEDPVEPVAHAWLDITGDGSAEDFTALLPPVAFRTAAGPAGAMLTTAGELAAFTRAFVTGALHSEPTVAEMRRWVPRPDSNQHGLGVLRIELDGAELIGHRGNAAGYSAAAWHAPEKEITVVVLTNEHARPVTPVVRALLLAAEAQ